MRLNQVYLRQYGPIQKDLELRDGINVVRGPNESGKSLLVEGLLKQLDSDSVPNSVVQDSPEGFVEVVDGGDSVKLDSDGSLSSFCEEQYNREIRSEELRNIFVIRSGDLTFNENDNFYTHITDKLTGQRVEDIDEIKDTLIDEGRLTPSNKDISSKSEYHDAGSQVSNARSLKQEVEKYIEEAREDGLQEAESDLFASKRQKEELDEEIEKLQQAEEDEEKRERYHELVGKKETIEGNLEELDDLPDKAVLEEIDERLKEFDEHEGQQDELRDQKESSLDLAKWSLGGGAVTFAALVIAGFPMVGVLATLLFLAGSGYFWREANNLSDEIAELGTREEDILSDARAAGLSFDERDQIREKIAEIEAMREELQEENQGEKAVLENQLEIEAESMKGIVRKAEDKLEKLEEDIDDSLEVEFDKQELDDAEQKLEEVEERIQELEDNLSRHRETVQGFREDVYELDFSIFVGERLDLEIENLDALEKLVDRMDEFISAIEDDAEASRVALDIFDEIQEEEKEETAELFEDGSRTTEIFREITDGRYDRVTYDSEENQLKVVKSTGETFTPRELSDGTRDQLYLSIRVALGEEVLDGQSGFFIMDDAFLTSDSTRLESQAEVVEGLAEEAWQIVYLSSKEDAISALASRCENVVIELNPLE